MKKIKFDKINLCKKDKKKIAVCRGNTVLGAVGFKFVMSNYKQNSNNYFENMLGETANIRCNRIPYFQVLVLLKELPYYDNSGRITRTEHINEHNLHKYIKLSEDNIETFFHTPTKTLIYVVSLSESLSDHHIANKAQYNEFFRDKDLNVDNEFNDLFQSGVVINDFAKFIKKVASCDSSSAFHIFCSSISFPNATFSAIVPSSIKIDCGIYPICANQSSYLSITFTPSLKNRCIIR